MLAISSLLATGWISQPVRQRPHRTAAPLRWDEILCGMTQVVTDIDDTIKSSGGVNIGGIALGGVDISYERNSFYPGVFQFGLELASHTAKPRDPPNKMAVLTARAEVRHTTRQGQGSSGTLTASDGLVGIVEDAETRRGHSLSARGVLLTPRCVRRSSSGRSRSSKARSCARATGAPHRRHRRPPG